MRPYQMVARFAGQCIKCRTKINVGDKAVRNPDGGRIWCLKNDGCGPAMLRASGAADLLGPKYQPGGA